MSIAQARRAPISRRHFLLSPLPLLLTAVAAGGTGRARAAGAASAGGTVSSSAPLQLRGAGASFPSKVYQAWALRHAQAGGAQLAYQATGSGDGVEQISARKVDLGGTDVPLAEAELQRRKLVQLPMLVGGVVPVVHLPELGGRPLRLSGELLAELMRGALTSWDAPALRALNPGLPLSARPVRRVVRKDKSGSTEHFTRYLAGQLPAFASEVGASALPAWPGEVLAAEGNDGVVELLHRQPGALGYLSHDRAAAAAGEGLSLVQLRNHDGNWVSASEAGFRSAIQNSEVYRQGRDTATLLDRPGAESWPVTVASFILVDARPTQLARASATLRFVYWCLMHGDELLRGSGFAPLPVLVQAKLAARLATVATPSGERPDYQVY